MLRFSAAFLACFIASSMRAFFSSGGSLEFSSASAAWRILSASAVSSELVAVFAISSAIARSLAASLFSGVGARTNPRVASTIASATTPAKIEERFSGSPTSSLNSRRMSRPPNNAIARRHRIGKSGVRRARLLSGVDGLASVANVTISWLHSSRSSSSAAAATKSLARRYARNAMTNPAASTTSPAHDQGEAQHVGAIGRERISVLRPGRVADRLEQYSERDRGQRRRNRAQHHADCG